MSSAGHHWLSVIMPVYNGGILLRDALESLRKHALEDCEIVVVDNASTDDTQVVLEGYARSLPLRVIRQEHAESWLVGANRALREARGEFVCMLHHDDAWLPERLVRLREAHEEFPDVGMFGHSVAMIGPSGDRIGEWRAPFETGRIRTNALMRVLVVQNCFAAPAPMVRRELALGVGGFNEKLWFTADWDLWLRCGAESDLVYLDEALAMYRLHPNQQSMLRTGSEQVLREQLSFPIATYSGQWLSRGLVDARTLETAAFSIEVNVFLAALAAGLCPSPRDLFAAASRCGPGGLIWYLRTARLLERSLPRMRLRLRHAF